MQTCNFIEEETQSVNFVKILRTPLKNIEQLFLSLYMNAQP